MLQARWLTISTISLAVFACAISARADSKTQSIAPGITHIHETRPGPLSIHVVKISRGQSYRFVNALGRGHIFGLSPLSKIAGRLKKRTGAAPLLGINGSFFHIKRGPYQGDPIGIQIVEGELVSGKGWGHCFWMKDGKPHIANVKTSFTVTWPGGQSSPFKLNEARDNKSAVLYTPRLGHRSGSPGKNITTRSRGGLELVLQPPATVKDGRIAVGQSYRCRLLSSQKGGNTRLSPTQFVLSTGPEFKVPALKVGDLITLKIATSPDLSGAKTAVGGGQLLMKAGRTPANIARARGKLHPRSFLGWNPKEILFFVVDGRQQRLSRGMSYSEMAETARRYGCTDAIEFDGGGSSTLWYLGKVRNSPSDPWPRSIGNGLFVFSKPGKTQKKWWIRAQQSVPANKDALLPLKASTNRR
jgi:hypothetical protein